MTTDSSTTLDTLRRAHVILAGLWFRRYLIIIPILLLPFVGLAISLVSEKNYITNTTILIQEGAKQNPFLQDLSVATNLKARMPALRALLHSRHVLTEVGRDLNLINDNTPAWKVEGVVWQLSTRLKATLVGDDLVRISYTSPKPSTMVKVIDAVSARFIDRIVAPERSAITSSEDFLRQQLEERHANLIDSERRLAEFKSEHAAELPNLHAANVDRLSSMRSRLAESYTELAGAQAEMDTAKQKLSQTNPMLGKIEQEILSLRAQLTTLRARYTASHSEVRAYERLLNSLTEERDKVARSAKPLTDEDIDRLWNMLARSENVNEAQTASLLLVQMENLHLVSQKVKSLEQEVSTMEGTILELEAQVSAFGQTELELRGLERDLRVKQSIYEDLQERAELAQVTRALGDYQSDERVKIIDRPYTPHTPTNQPFWIFMLAGLMGGLLTGIGIALVAEFIDTTIRTKNTLVQLTGMPVLARIPPA